MGRVSKKTASRDFFFFPNFIVHKHECTGGGEQTNLFFLKNEKKSLSRPFLAHSGGGQETFLFKGGLGRLCIIQITFTAKIENQVHESLKI